MVSQLLSTPVKPELFESFARREARSVYYCLADLKVDTVFVREVMGHVRGGAEFGPFAAASGCKYLARHQHINILWGVYISQGVCCSCLFLPDLTIAKS
ncbi:MAG: hypothetical protein WAW69_11905, partial [Polaromonas sp.]